MRKLRVFLEEIKFSHTVFALPFALVAMLLAAGGLPSAWTFLWILVAAVAARTAAMTFNRLADHEFDARNPRTAGRALVTGELTTRDMATRFAASAIIFMVAAGMLNTTCLLLSVPTLAVLCGYSLTKRITDWSHLFLGLALGLAPLGAWIAVTGSLASWVPLLLSLAVLTWVAGFDVLYACQDVEVDRREEALHSLPKRHGVAGAMAWARRLHAVSLALFLGFWWVAGLGMAGLIGVLAVGGLLVRQHALVSPRDLSRIDAAFFTSNGVLSVVFLALVAIDVLA